MQSWVPRFPLWDLLRPPLQGLKDSVTWLHCLARSLAHCGIMEEEGREEAAFNHEGGQGTT